MPENKEKKETKRMKEKTMMKLTMVWDKLNYHFIQSKL
jgi:hypothetical protein